MKYAQKNIEDDLVLSVSDEVSTKKVAIRYKCLSPFKDIDGIYGVLTIDYKNIIFLTGITSRQLSCLTITS